MRRVLSSLVIASALAASAPARADANAEALKAFDEGKRARDAQDWPKCAAQFDKSAQLSPSVGAFYNLGFCLERQGNLRGALDAYRDSRKKALETKDDRAKDAELAVSKLLEAHGWVKIAVPDDVARADGLRIVVDGEEAPLKQVTTRSANEVFRNAPLHDIVISARGRKDNHLKAKDKTEIAVALGEPESAAPVTPPPPPPPPGTPPAPDDGSGGGGGTQRAIGIGMIGAGVVGVVIGAVFTGAYYGNQSDLVDEYDRRRADECRVTPRPPQCAGLQAEYAGKIDDNTSEFAVKQGIAYGLGGVLVGVGLYLLLSAPDSKPTAVRVVASVGTREGEGGLSVVGRF